MIYHPIKVLKRKDFPLQGDDGKDYKNICELNLEACSKKNPISVAYEGPCGKII